MAVSAGISIASQASYSVVKNWSKASRARRLKTSPPVRRERAREPTARALEREQEIYSVAAELFHRKGYAATSPALLASFATVRAGEHLVTEPRATSELYVVMKGAGTTEIDGEGRAVAWAEGDVFVLPSGCRSLGGLR